MAVDRRRVTYQRQASADVRGAYLWYEEQRSGLGEEFLRSLKEAEDFVAASPLACSVVHRKTRRALLKRFPYGLYFRLVDDEIVVVACYHGKRHPLGWKLRR